MLSLQQKGGNENVLRIVSELFALHHVLFGLTLTFLGLMLFDGLFKESIAGLLKSAIPLCIGWSIMMFTHTTHNPQYRASFLSSAVILGVIISIQLYQKYRIYGLKPYMQFCQRMQTRCRIAIITPFRFFINTLTNTPYTGESSVQDLSRSSIPHHSNPRP